MKGDSPRGDGRNRRIPASDQCVEDAAISKQPEVTGQYKTMTTFDSLFQELAGHPPFPWQKALFERFLQNDVPQSCQLPTGLGKTSIAPVWLIALGLGAPLPRRLVYVVNRRTVVDQTTNEIVRIRQKLLQTDSSSQQLRELKSRLQSQCAFETDVPFAISTLRGQFADNQEWATDPTRPAVICGTVDMIGSRLLFSGYRIGFRSRPLHAGFLGQDTLIVHDEAHLEPAFQTLLGSIQAEQGSGRFPDLRPLRVMELTATSRGQRVPFRLTDEDRNHPVVQSRLQATKQLQLHPVTEEKKELVTKLTQLALEHQESGAPILIFARSVEVVEQVADALEKKFSGQDRIARLTGTMRGLERDRLARENGVFLRFLPEVNRPEEYPAKDGTVYLVCTSAGEVGVNLSAHHLICDLSTYESMAQRFGRVNRFGSYDDTRIDVVHPNSFAEDDKLSPLDLSRKRTLGLLRSLQGDASPAALESLNPEDCLAGFAPVPPQLPTSDILFDSWSLTTITEKLPGRPPVDDYLHGIPTDWERPRTSVAWREEVQVLGKIIDDDSGQTLLDVLGLSPDELLEDYPVKAHETLEDDSGRIYDKLKKIAGRCDAPVWVIDRDGTTRVTSLSALTSEKKEDFDADLILLPPTVGGLSGGMLDPSSLIADDVADQWTVESDGNELPRRLRVWDQQSPPPGMRLIRTIDTKPDNDVNDEELNPVETEEEKEGANGHSAGRFWRWYLRPNSADDDGSKIARFAIPLQQHTDDVLQRANAIGSKLLGDYPQIAEALNVAAFLHDFGKRRVLWQRGIGNPVPTRWYAKSGLDPETNQIWRVREQSHYRHEFGSIMDLLSLGDKPTEELAEVQKQYRKLSPEMQDLVLHLVAAHHGRARPRFKEIEAFDPDYGLGDCDTVAAEIPQRFARLQRRYGRWGLAWLESLLRAADIAASRQASLSESASEPELEEV